MPFLKDLGADPLSSRVYLVLFGPGKIGKTRAALNLVTDHKQLVYILSVDRGLLYAFQNPKLFKGRLGAYVESGAWTLRTTRKNLADVRARIDAKVRDGVNPGRLWVVVDTITHLQTAMLAEARHVQVSGGHGKEMAKLADEYEREMVTQVDYMVNLGHMSEIADALVGMPCNVVVNALEKAETKGRDKTGVMLPALSGGAYTRILGDADAVMHLETDKEGDRFFKTFVQGSDSGDRSGNLERTETADLMHIRNKMLGLDKVSDEATGTNESPANEEASPS